MSTPPETAAPGDDPTLAQRRAADPKASAWVSASAGSGKTKVLTDRVLSLLLAGVAPERLLCITFTKAAAAEMAGRLNETLARWASDEDADLADALAGLAGQAPAPETLARARHLFARVLDAAGGLKIQTIHAFCQSLLARFPVEAGIPPHFEVMDDRSAQELMRDARDTVLARAGSATGELAEAMAEVSSHIQEDRFADLLRALSAERGRLARMLRAHGDRPDRVAEAVYRALGARRDWTRAGLIAEACADDAFDALGLRLAGEALRGAKAKSDPPRGAALAAWLAADRAGRAAGLDAYRAVFLTAEGAVRRTLATQGVLRSQPGLADVLTVEAERLAALNERLAAEKAARASAALIAIGREMLAAYDRAKAATARLDYDDLILRARDLLTAEPGRSAWVLYKLDGGIDHVLVDEAQDTNPEQWEVIDALTGEFFAGEGRQAAGARTVFAVGDAKQSIYSFQRADPAAFARMREHFAGASARIGAAWRAVPLTVSFRSAQAVLRAVDLTFARPPASIGVAEDDRPVAHRAWRRDAAGRVELWPLALADAEEDPEAWEPAIEPKGGIGAEERLAQGIARRLGDWIGRDGLPDRDRPVRARDVMVLVRRRSAFVDLLVKALKGRGVPVAGSDRMILSDQIAVMDLIAVGQALLLPQDDLTLATVLKTPFCGLDDDDLFALAHPRGRGETLWRRLLARDNDARLGPVVDWLRGLRGRIDYPRPFELFSAILDGPCPGGGAAGRTGRQALVARLGAEVEDPLEEFLSLSLAFERLHPPSMQRFLAWFAAGQSEIKRDLEQLDRDEVRVMTVHGAKGLQAPIVILADTVAKPRDPGPGLYWRDGLALWRPRADASPAPLRALRDEAEDAREREYRRLLYVAMTRAEDRLIVCGWKGKRDPIDKGWFGHARAGLPAIAAEGEDGTLVLATPQEAVLPKTKAAAEVVAPAPLPVWARAVAPREPTPPRPLAPSRPASDEPPVRSPLQRDGTDPFKRGVLLHRLLQLLPDMEPARRREAGRALLSRPVHALTGEQVEAWLEEVLAVLDDPEFAPVFAPGSRAEVPIVGQVTGPEGLQIVSGRIDRLAVGADEVLIVDYKTNRPPPSSIDAVADTYMRQMATYRSLVASLYPGRAVLCSLLWTDGPTLMPLPDPLLQGVGALP